MSAGVIIRAVVVRTSVNGRFSASSARTVRAKLSVMFPTRNGWVAALMSACRG